MTSALVSDDSDDEADANVGAIVGGVVGGIVSIALILSSLLFLRRRRRRRRRARHAIAAMSEPKLPDDIVISTQPETPQLDGNPVPDKAVRTSPASGMLANTVSLSDPGQVIGDAARHLSIGTTSTAVSAQPNASLLHSDIARNSSVGTYPSLISSEPRASQLHGDSVQNPGSIYSSLGVLTTHSAAQAPDNLRHELDADQSSTCVQPQPQISQLHGDSARPSVEANTSTETPNTPPAAPLSGVSDRVADSHTSGTGNVKAAGSSADEQK